MRTLIVLLLATAVLFLGFGLMQRRPGGQDPAQERETSATTPARPPGDAPSIRSSDSRYQAIRQQLKTTAGELDQTKEQLAQAQLSLTNAGRASDTLRELGVNDFIKLQQQKMLKQMLQEEFTGLEALLKLEPEKQRLVDEKLASRKQLEMSFGMEMMTAKPEEKADLQARFDSDYAAANQELMEALGVEGKEKFDWFESTQFERQQLKEFQAAAGAIQVDPQQREKLFELANQEKSTTRFTIDFTRPNRMPEDWKKENLDQFFTEVESMNSRIALKAGTLLTPSELSEYLLAQKLHLEKERSRLRMILSLVAR